jgi:protein-S-isoprenylcysteine O-methyltransferase
VKEILEETKGVPPVPQSPPFSMSRPPPAAILGLFWGLSEFLLTMAKRSKSNVISKDRHSLGLIWLVNLSAIALGIFAARRLYGYGLPWPKAALETGYCLFALGLVLRWYAVIYLGRFFTTNVAIAADHRVIDSGPYRFVRHPSYIGSLLATLGLSLSFQNWISFLVIFVPICAVMRWRIHVEEQALTSALGTAYATYARRTKRLIPFIY